MVSRVKENHKWTRNSFTTLDDDEVVLASEMATVPPLVSFFFFNGGVLEDRIGGARAFWI